MPKSKFALGKATEYKVASIFLDADCEVYLPAVDDHGVDMLVIPPKNLNDMLSLPLSTGGLFAAISCPNPRPNYFYVFYIRSIETYWLIPSLDFVKIASQNSATCKNAFKYSLTLATGKGELRRSEYIIKRPKP